MGEEDEVQPHLRKGGRQKQLQERRKTLNTRIVGGRPSAPNSYPFYVYWTRGCG